LLMEMASPVGRLKINIPAGSAKDPGNAVFHVKIQNFRPRRSVKASFPDGPKNSLMTEIPRLHHDKSSDAVILHIVGVIGGKTEQPVSHKQEMVKIRF